MTSLTAIFGHTADDNADSEKLLELYWNRAELKKEFASLRDETFTLKARIKEEQGRTLRARQQLEQLESLLLDPAWAHNAVACYQLRALNGHLQGKLARFAEQLKQQREKRQHSKVLAEWATTRDEEAARLRGDLAAVQQQAEQLEQRLQFEHRSYGEMSAVGRFFKRRRVTAKLDEIAAQMDAARMSAQSLNDRLGEIADSESPDVPGLDVSSKRSINFMILSFAQQQYLHFEKDALASLAHEAGSKGPGAINYGGSAECAQILERIAQRRESMAKASDLADVLQARAKLIAQRARFASADDAVPASATVGTVFDIDEVGNVRETEANLLGMNYWGLARLMSG